MFTDPDTLDAWNSFFSDPGGTLDASWDLVYGSYRALFDSSLGSQSAIARTLVQSTPLILVGLSVWRSGSRGGCRTIRRARGSGPSRASRG